MAHLRTAPSITLLMAIAMLTAAPLTGALAAPAANDTISVEIPSARVTSAHSQADSDEQTSWFMRNVPALEQALIIFTGVNAILIVVGGIAYTMKKRLENVSASTLAAIKDKQDSS